MTTKIVGNDFYCVYNDFDISNRIKELNLLYLPLIGSDAVKLYQFLATKIVGEKNLSTNFLHYDIFDNLFLDSSKFVIARKKLEAMGLLYSYYIDNEGKNLYVYKIREAVSFKNFFEQPALVQLLENSIGVNQVKSIKNKYSYDKVSFNSFTNLTAKFSDVYTTSNLDDYTFESIIAKKEDNTPNFDEYYFDFDKLNYLLANKYLSEILDDNENKNNILALAHLYKADSADMAKAIENSVNMSGNSAKLNFDKLKDYLIQLFVNVRKQEEPVLNKMINKKLLEELEPEELSREDKFAKTTDNMNYVDYLKNQRKLIVSETDAVMIEQLQKKYNFPTGVLNILLDYSITASGNSGLPTKNYIDKIASGWSSVQLLGAKDAINYVRRNRDNRKNSSKKQSNPNKQGTYKNTSVYKAPVPDYIQNQINNIGNNEPRKNRIPTKEDDDAYNELMNVLQKGDK